MSGKKLTVLSFFSDGRHVVFGKVMSGMETVTMIENSPTNPGDRPKQDIVIADCVELEVPEEGERIEL